jgi:hypothetical protein
MLAIKYCRASPVAARARRSMRDTERLVNPRKVVKNGLEEISWNETLHNIVDPEPCSRNARREANDLRFSYQLECLYLLRPLHMDTNSSKTFPLREAYSFAVANGLGDQVALIRELERRGLLSTFISQVWPVGSTPRGEAQLRFCLRVASEYDDFVGGARPGRARRRGSRRNDLGVCP